MHGLKQHPPLKSGQNPPQPPHQNIGNGTLYCWMPANDGPFQYVSNGNVRARAYRRSASSPGSIDGTLCTGLTATAGPAETTDGSGLRGGGGGISITTCAAAEPAKARAISRPIATFTDFSIFGLGVRIIERYLVLYDIPTTSHSMRTASRGVEKSAILTLV
jgi:hypothetical protein